MRSCTMPRKKDLTAEKFKPVAIGTRTLSDTRDRIHRTVDYVGSSDIEIKGLESIIMSDQHQTLICKASVWLVAYESASS
jgi:hypothetical protein